METIETKTGRTFVISMKSDEDKRNRLCLIASPDGRQGSLSLKQDVLVYSALLEKGGSLAIPLATNRHAWLHLARGSLRLGEFDLNSGDGVAISKEKGVELIGLTDSELLVFDLA